MADRNDMNLKETKRNSESVDTLLDMLEDEERPMTKSERTRLRIMASAAKVFTEKGFGDTSIQDIADDAGIAKGTIYYYVNKKEDLMVALLRFEKTRLFARVERSIARAATAEEKIETLLRNHLRMMKVVGPIMLMFAQNLVSSDPKLRNTLAGVREEYLALLSGVIDEGIAAGEFRPVDSHKTAVAVLGMLIGQVFQQRLFTKSLNTKQIADTTLDMVLNGLRVRHED